jgi:LmbE family N-acetylglucosaminyl deacetylase
MLPIDLPSTRTPLRILCVGAHCDDIEIGCGATLLHLQASRRIIVDYAILTGTAERRTEAARAMRLLLKPEARGRLFHGEHPDARLPGCYAALKDYFSLVRAQCDPHLVFTHERTDAHQDHRIANEMTWGAFRDHLIAEYEIPKWEGIASQPNCFVPVSLKLAQRKIALLMKAFGSQRSHDWFRPETFESLMRLRGIECRSASGLAEAFVVRKMILS